MFLGSTVLSMDAKGRLAIPMRYRNRLQELCASRLVITVEQDGSLLLFPENEWAEFERSLMKLPNMNVKGKARMLQRFYAGNAQEIEMDGQGRILLPPTLRKFAKLDEGEGKVVLVGQGNKFEIWAEDTWNRKLAEWGDQLGEMTDLSDDITALSQLSI